MRLRWACLIPLSVLTAAFEAIGAAGIFALIKLLSTPPSLPALPLFAAIVSFFPWREGNGLIFSFTALIAVFYIAKNCLAAVSVYLQSKMTTDSAAALSRQMLQGYLSAPYTFHFARNSAELIRNTTDSAEAVFRLNLMPAVNIASESFVLLGLIIVLLATAPTVTLIATTILFSLLLILLKLTRRSFIRLGAREQNLKRTILKSLQQSLGGLKEIKVLGRERFFFNDFTLRHRALTRLRARHLTLSAIPRFLIEAVFVSGILLLIALLTAYGNVGVELIPLLGLYAYAGFRIIPSVLRIMASLNDLRYGLPITQRLHQDYLTFGQQDVDPFSSGSGEEKPRSLTNCIVFEHIAYSYDGSPRFALRDINFTIHRGESMGIVGPTGAGKSTLIDVLLGLLTPSSGRLMVDGEVIANSFSLRSWRKQIGYVPQNNFFTDDTIRRNIALGIEDAAIDEAKLKNAVAMAQLEEMISTLPLGLNTVVGERGIRLSGGQRQRIAIARALYHQPAVLVFDEATSALDNQTEQEVIRAIERLRGRKTLVIVAHRLSTVRSCDRLVFLQDGQIASCGTFDELMQNNADFRRMSMLADLNATGAIET
jgi:ATP-binding cassette subfamily C protein